ncbi:polyketide synthase [Apiospora rasikravindrae]|uniref:Polyketide synthase n=1 Tax=Apiospora rasikravindrae TaxID=990691 RepID=A0ABR1RPH6_9PEZI
MKSATVLLFGDQLASKTSAVNRLYEIAKTRPSLHAFLRDATDVVQCLRQDLHPCERQLYGDFADVRDLTCRHEAAEHLNEAVGTTLITIIQLGELLQLAEDEPAILHAESQTHGIGVCIGLLAAAVAATATTARDVVRLGLECVAISFRLGIELWRRTRSVEDSPESWACTFVGIDAAQVQERLDLFNRDCPRLRAAYVGVQASTWATVFAPPATLKRLMDSEHFSQVSTSRLASAIAVHAAHLPLLDTDRILGISLLLDTPARCEGIFSSSTCEPFAASTLRDLLSLIIADIAQHPLYLEDTIKNVASSLQGISNARLLTVGPTHSVSFVQRELQRIVPTVTVSHINIDDEYSSNEYRRGSDRVAIVGMSGRFPDSDSVSELWELLLSGRSAHQRIPESRFPIDDFLDPSCEAPMAVSTTFGCFLKNPGEFDNLLFSISPREAVQMDPVQRLLLMTTYEALQMAGYSPDATASTLRAHMATFLGQSAEEWKAINDQEGIDTHYIPGTMRSFAPGRLNHYFRWGGGITSIDTACSASATAVHLACNALLTREVDCAIAGGGHVCVAPELYSGLSKGGFLSKTGPCKTFCDDADGYCRGEAVGVVVLKRLEDAVREKDNILAVLRGTARNTNAGAAGSITFPSSAAQADLYRTILQSNGVSPNEISYVECHGTGTQAGDAAELSAIIDTFSASRPSDFPLHIGALKAAIGHAEGAAGFSSLIKAILIMQKRIIPPQPNWPFKINHKFPDLDKVHIKVADGTAPLRPSRDGNGLAKIIVNSFDAAGGNVSMLIEEAPEVSEWRSEDQRPHHVVACSGRTRASLEANEARLKEYLLQHPGTDLASLAYTTTARRMHELHRSAHVVESVQDLLGKFGTAYKAPLKDARLIFSFTGQGSVYTGMGAELYHTMPSFRATLDSFQDLCDAQSLDRFLDLIIGAQDVVTATACQTQLALVALEVAMAHLLASLDLQPTLVMGHSLGEYAALCVAGVLSVSDMLYLVHTRASLIQEHCTSHTYSMLAVNMSFDDASDLLSESKCPTCQIACINAPGMTVISGTNDELSTLRSTLQARGVKSSLLKVPYGFHSSQLEPVLEQFEEAARKVHFNAPRVPVASTLLGEVVRDEGVFNAAYLRRQMREPVNFLGALSSSALTPVCTALLAKSCSTKDLTTLSSLQQGQDGWRSFSNCLAALHVAGLSVNWREFHRDSEPCLRLLDLPAYAFDAKTYWVPYKTRRAVQSTSEVAMSAHQSLPYSFLQRLDSLSSEDGKTEARFTSSSTHPELTTAIQGHIVGGVVLCPASVFVEMAHTAVFYLLKSTGLAGEGFHLEVADLQMTHALVVHAKDEEHLIHIDCSMEDTDTEVAVTFSSTGPTGASASHGLCKVRFSAQRPSKIPQWGFMENLVRRRVANLLETAKGGPTHRISRDLFYKLFEAEVDYGKPYQCIEEAYLPPDFQDAVAACVLDDSAGSQGQFTCNPFTMDGIVHLSGFLLNADPAKPKDVIHISNRIGSFQLLAPITNRTHCMCYATVREKSAKGITVCDVYVFDQDGLIALCSGITFQRMTKEIFSIVIGSRANGGPSAPAPAPKIVAAPLPSRGRRLRDFPDPPSSSQDKTARTVSLREAPNHADTLLSIVAKRTGVSLDELEPATDFTDIGVDSQMSIAITSDLQKQTGVQLPAAFFLTYTTVAEARKQLGAAEPTKVNPSPSKASGESPAAKQSSSAPKGVRRGASSSSTERPSEILLQIVASALGMAPSDFADVGDFEAAGVDSMLSIKVMSQYKQKTGQELPASFFLNHPTVADVEAELDGNVRGADTEPGISSSSSSSSSMVILTPPAEITSNAVLIQGDPDSKQRPVFMIADGHGSADAFVHLSPLENNQRLYALESPFIDDPDAFDLSIPDLAKVFIRTIRRLQPRGPYLIGGRSAGAGYAYEVAYQLAVVERETLSGLLLIDMRVPRAIPQARHIDTAFVARAWKVIVEHTKVLLDPGDLAHAAATIKALHSYTPRPFPASCPRRPRRVAVVWARWGVNENPDQTLRDAAVQRPAAMGPTLGEAADPAAVSLADFEAEFKSWFWGARSTFGPNGWDALLGGEVQVHTVDGDHFCMMKQPYVRSLSAVVTREIAEMERLK